MRTRPDTMEDDGRWVSGSFGAGGAMVPRRRAWGWTRVEPGQNVWAGDTSHGQGTNGWMREGNETEERNARVEVRVSDECSSRLRTRTG